MSDKIPKKERRRPRNKCNKSSKSSTVNTTIFQTPDANKFCERTQICDESVNDANKIRFMTPSEKGESKRDRLSADQASLDVHGGVMYPSRHYAFMRGSPVWLQIRPGQSDNNRSKKEQSTERQQNYDVNQPGICCRCLYQKMFPSCYCNHWSGFMGYPCYYGAVNENYESEADRTETELATKTSSNTGSQASRISEADKNIEAETACAKDRELASTYVNKANAGFEKAIKSEAGGVKIKLEIKRSKRSRSKNDQ